MTRFMRTTLFLALGILLLGITGSSPARRSSDPPSRSRFAVAYARLPLHFEANQGQVDPAVKFLARGQGYTLFLASDEVVFGVPTGERPALVRMKLLGADPAAEIVGRDELPGKVNYFRGRDPVAWQTNVPTYAKVLYRAVYPGVDLVFYGRQGRFEYDFVVAPGAEPTAIRLAVDGADSLRLDTSGDVVLAVGKEEVRIEKPLVYQLVDGARREVPGRFVLAGTHELAFRVDAYDRARPLVIDPTLVFSTYLGGSGNEGACCIAVDGAGNIYVAGATSSPDFPVTPGATQDTLRGTSGVFIVKLNPAGSALLYATYLGGEFEELVGGLAIDGVGNALVTGLTFSKEFPTVNAIQPTLTGSCDPRSLFADAFVAKLDSTGSALVYSTYFGGCHGDFGAGIAVDGMGNAYVTGELRPGDDLPLITTHFHPTARGGAFVLKLDPDGSLAYAADFGQGIGSGIAVDSRGSAYVAGVTGDFDPGFPTTPGAFQRHGAGLTDGFVAKLDPSGSSLVYSTLLGGEGEDNCCGIAVDSAGSAYVAGRTASVNFPTRNPLQPTLHGSIDAFVAKLNRTGSALIYSTFLGGNDAAAIGIGDGGGPIAVDSAGSAYVAGVTPSTDFPTVNASQAKPGQTFPGWDAFVAKLTANGSALVYSTYLGGSRVDRAVGIALDGAGNAYVVGTTFSPDFPTANAMQPALRGFTDAFVAKIADTATGGSCTKGLTIGPTSATPATAAPGSTETVRVQVCSASAATLNVVVEVYNANGKRIGQQFFTGQSFAAGESKSYSWDFAVPSTLPAGTYTVKVGVFSASWTLLKWDDQAATFAVGDAPPPSSCTSGVTIGPTSATPSPVARGGTETIQTQVCSGSALSNVNVNLELYSASGKRVGQKIFSGETLAAGEAKSYTWNFPVPSTLPTGTYTVKVGVFSANWTTLFTWDNQAATFVAQ